MDSFITDGAFLEKNQAAAAKAWPRILAGEILKGPDSENYIPEDCFNGEKTVRARANRDSPFIYVHSKYDPSGVAARFAEKISAVKNRGAVILGGMGFGHEVRALLKALDPEDRIIVCEPDYDMLRLAFRCADLTDIMLDGRVFAVAGASFEELDDLFRDIFNMGSIEKVMLVKMPAYARLINGKPDAAREALLSTAKYYSILRNSLVNLCELWYRSLFANLKTIASSCLIDNFFGCLDGKPAVLVSAGPSLNKNAGLLRGIKGKTFILCVYTALKVLEKLGVRPDMVISLDGKQIIYRDFQNYEFDMPLIYCNTINPEMFAAHRGKTVAAMTGNDAFLAGVLSELGVSTTRVQTGESVACAAVDILCKMGADPVIFIGQDFAYSDGKNHADGTFYDGKNSSGDIDSRKFPVEAWDGGTVLTDDMWFVYLEWFRRYIAGDGGKRTFVDATEGGALIKGAERMTFREAIQTYCVPGYDTEAALAPGFGKGPMLGADQVNKLADKLTRVREDLKLCLEPLRSGIGLSERLAAMYEKGVAPDPEDVNRVLGEFAKIDAVLEEIKASAPIMDTLFSKSTFDLNFERPEDMCEGAYVAKRSLILYKSLLEAAEITLPLVEGTIGELKNDDAQGGGSAPAAGKR
ncbi:MAG: DUF115 domain-containing protein [Firmicutes bacterium]|nr:DUF115 domain-containing protein [Bacillota bacterium]